MDRYTLTVAFDDREPDKMHAPRRVGQATLDHLSDVLSNLGVANMSSKQIPIRGEVTDVPVKVAGVQAARIPRQKLHDAYSIAGAQSGCSGHDDV